MKSVTPWNRSTAPTASRSSSEPRAAASSPSFATVEPLVERLARLHAGGHWVVSCYLKLEPRDRARGKYLIKLKNRIRERLSWLERRGLDRAAREAVAQDLDRVRGYLEDPSNLPPGRGIAIFACAPLGLLAAVPLPQVFRSRLAVDRTPLVRELAAVDDEFGRVLCVAYDRTSARFFDVTAFGVDELPGLAAGDTTRTGRFHGVSAVARGGAVRSAAGEHNFNQRIRVEKQRHYAEIAQRLFELARTNAVRGMVLAGTGADAGAVTPHLHPYVARLVLGSARLNPKSVTPPEVFTAVLTVQGRSERAWEAEHIKALREGLGTGWATNGFEPTLRALARGQVRTLLVDAERAQPGFRCTTSGRLSVTAEACGAEGEVEPVPDLIDDAMEEALRQHAQVDVVEDRAARAKVDGVAALLRFR
jgi:peptide chain release factor subunit 1